MKYKLKEYVAISEAGVLFNPFSGESYSINDPGMEIITQIRRNQSKEEILTNLMENYEVEPELISSDLEDFILFMLHHQLIELQMHES